MTDEQWELVADLFDPPGRRGAPARIPRRQMVEAMLSWPAPAVSGATCPAWTAVWAQRRRWRANGVWARAMLRLTTVVRILHERQPLPSMVIVDAQSVKGGRYGPTFHDTGGPGGRVFGTKRTMLVEILGLPLAAAAWSARPHDVTAGRELLRTHLSDLPRLRAVVGDRAYRGLTRLAARRHVALDIKAPPPGRRGFTLIRPLYKIEHAFAQLGHWRRLSRCYEAARPAPAPGSRSPLSATWPGGRWPEADRRRAPTRLALSLPHHRPGPAARLASVAAPLPHGSTLRRQPRT